jgi:hypothetical protein
MKIKLIRRLKFLIMSSVNKKRKEKYIKDDEMNTIHPEEI